MRSVKDILNSSAYKTQINSDQWRSFSAGIRRTRKSCECCRRTDVQTQVHHLFYDHTRALWEYGSDDVVVLCYDCHKQIHEQLNQFRKHVFKYLNGKTFKVLNGALAVALTQYDPTIFVHALAEFVSNPRLVQNHAAAWNSSAKNKTDFKPKHGIVDLPKDYKELK